MSIEKRAQRIRQTPKHLEKMLFVNHKEEQGLQRRLETIATDSRVRGRLLDRERIKVRNESRFNSRLNYQNIAPLLDRIPHLIQREMTKHGYTVESINDYLLREYRRNSMVIPSILSSIGKEQNKDDVQTSESNQTTPTQTQNTTLDRKPSLRVNAVSNSANSGFPPQKWRMNEPVDDKKNRTSESGDINPRRITNLVKDITKIRNDMYANKKIDVMRSRRSFPELLRNVQEQDKQVSDSDTFTDGTCVLLRRKMQKIRKHTAPDPDLEVYALLGQGHSSGSDQLAGVPKVPRKRHSVAQSTFQNQGVQLPSIATSKSATTMGAIARQNILENDERELKRQLDEQERQHTEMKVAIEVRKYQHIQRRINDFLQETPKRPALPLLFESDVS